MYLVIDISLLVTFDKLDCFEYIWQWILRIFVFFTAVPLRMCQILHFTRFLIIFKDYKATLNSVLLALFVHIVKIHVWRIEFSISTISIFPGSKHNSIFSLFETEQDWVWQHTLCYKRNLIETCDGLVKYGVFIDWECCEVLLLYEVLKLFQSLF